MAERVVMIVPTAINIITLVTDTLTRSLRSGLVPSVTLPSLYRRAQLIVKEADVVPIVVTRMDEVGT